MSKGPNAGRPERRGCLPGLLIAAGALLGAATLHRAASEGAGGKPPDPESLWAHHELKDMRPRQVIFWLGLLVIAVTGLAIVVTVFEGLIIGHLGNVQAVVANPPNAPPAPLPRLETANGQVLGELHAKEDILLDNYTWIDQAAGTVRIPIDRAIDLIAQRGLPTQKSQGNAAQNGSISLPERSSSGRQAEGIP